MNSSGWVALVGISLVLLQGPRKVLNNNARSKMFKLSLSKEVVAG